METVLSLSNVRATVDAVRNKRALLIGINHYLNPCFNDLDGSINDVQLVFKLLTDTFKFPPENVTRVTDDTNEKPTRHGILFALSRLVAETGDDDLVVVFYAGHGSRRRNSAKPNGYNETIVPSDSGRTRGHKANGEFTKNLDITDDELHELMLRPLTSKTSNLVLIFDSCHSGHVLRELHCAKARFVEPDESDVFSSDSVEARPESRTIKGSSGWLPMNDRYVLLAACQAHEKANEKHVTFTDANSVETLIHGAWTYELCRAILAETQTETSTYRSVFERAFPLVTEAFPAQHPTMEGMLNRAVFGMHIVPTMPYAIVLNKTVKQVELSCGAAHGFSLGSQFVICAKGTKLRPPDEDPATIGTCEITEVGAVRSWACGFKSSVDLNKIEIGCPAFETVHAFDNLKVGVRVVFSPLIQQWIASQEHSTLELERLKTYHSEIAEFVNRSTVLFLVEAEDTVYDCITVHFTFSNKSIDQRAISEHCKPSYIVYGADGHLEIDKPLSVDSEGTMLLKNKLELLGKYHRVLRLNNSYQQNNPLFNKVELHLSQRSTDSSPWCDILHNQTSLLPILFEDQFIGATIINNSCSPVEIALIELAEDGSVNILHPPNGTTETIEQGNSIFVGHEWGALEVASSIRCQETFKLFVTTEKTDFTMLEQCHFRGTLESTLEELLCTNKMRLVRKRSTKGSFWTTVQKSFEIRQKTERSIVTEPGCSNHFESTDTTLTLESKKTTFSYENNADKLTEKNHENEIQSYPYSTLSSVALYENLFASFKQENAKNNEESIANFYEQFNLRNRDNSVTILQNESTFAEYLTALLRDEANILPVYRMIRSIWVDDGSAIKAECQVLQNRLSLTGFSHLVNCMDPLVFSEEFAIAHYNIGYILTRNCDIFQAKEAIRHFEIALEIWDKEHHADDHGQTLTKIADLYGCLCDLAETSNEQLLYAKTAVTLYKTAHTLLESVASTEVYLVIFNMTILLSRMSNDDATETFAEEIELALVMIENAITVLRNQPMTNETAENLIDMLSLLTAQNGLFRRNIALPWQEEVITICNGILSSNVIDVKFRTECNEMLGDAWSSRLIGNRRENLKAAVDHLLAVAQFYSDQLEMDNHSILFAKCVINLGATVDELRTLHYSPETDVYVKKSKELLTCVASDAMQLHDDSLKLAALYNLSRLAGDNIPDLLELLPIAAEHAPRVCGHIQADIALKMVLNSFPSSDELSAADNPDEDCMNGEAIEYTFHTGIGFSNARFEQLKCNGGAKCCHTPQVLRYLQEAEERLHVERDTDTNYLKNLGVMGRYWATHCTLPPTKKLNHAWSTYLKAIGQVERLWPLYNVDAQVSLMNEVGQIWEDALDVTVAQYFLQTDQQGDAILHRLVSILCNVKSRNLFPVSDWMQSNSNKAKVSRACTTPSSTSLSVFETASVQSNIIFSETELQSNLIGLQSLQDNEVVAEWWMSTKQYAFCIIYSKNEDVKMFHMWNRAESAHLYELCLDAHIKLAAHFWDKTFVHRLSRALCLEELLAFLKSNFPTATKLFLLPHVYLYCCQIHVLPIFEDKSLSLLDFFSEGISYLPNFKMLNITRQSVLNNTQAVPKVFLFQADPNHDLPYSKQEVHKIEATIIASQNTCDLTTNTTAEVFTKKMASIADDSDFAAPFFLHVACHGEYNENKPAKSYLLLEDGKFTMAQFQDISLSHCQLAVLSACNSGLRDFKRSHMTDIFIGFGAQFLAKGCKNVLLTLSPISDKASAELMLHFYRGIFDEKKSIASSLRDAQITLRNNSTSKNAKKPKQVLLRLVGKKGNETALTGNEKLFGPFVLLGAGDYKLP